MSTPEEALNDLAQVRDELRVIWLALNSTHAADYVERIGEHVTGLVHRLDAISERLTGDGA